MLNCFLPCASARFLRIGVPGKKLQLLETEFKLIILHLSCPDQKATQILGDPSHRIFMHRM